MSTPAMVEPAGIRSFSRVKLIEAEAKVKRARQQKEQQQTTFKAGQPIPFLVSQFDLAWPAKGASKLKKL